MDNDSADAQAVARWLMDEQAQLQAASNRFNGNHNDALATAMAMMPGGHGHGLNQGLLSSTSGGLSSGGHYSSNSGLLSSMNSSNQGLGGLGGLGNSGNGAFLSHANDALSHLNQSNSALNPLNHQFNQSSSAPYPGSAPSASSMMNFGNSSGIGSGGLGSSIGNSMMGGGMGHSIGNPSHSFGGNHSSGNPMGNSLGSGMGNSLNSMRDSIGHSMGNRSSLDSSIGNSMRDSMGHVPSHQGASQRVNEGEQAVLDFLVSGTRTPSLNSAMSKYNRAGSAGGRESSSSINNNSNSIIDASISNSSTIRTNSNSILHGIVGGDQEGGWACEACGEPMPPHLHRCRACKKWRESTLRPASSVAVAASTMSANNSNTNSPSSDLFDGDATLQVPSPSVPSMPQTIVPANSGIEICTTRKTNERGRPLCKVVGCNKLDQAKNDGFCRMHFNLFSVANKASGNGTGDNDSDEDANWTCNCGNIISAKQSRCGKCHRWRGGKRKPYTMGDKKESSSKKKKGSSKKSSSSSPTKASSSLKKKKKSKSSSTSTSSSSKVASQLEAQTLDGDGWACECGKVVDIKKSRCGSCHRWKGGKRKGGWTIKGTRERDNVADGIDWEEAWTCCGNLLAASKSRCGECNRWRGGKRRPKKSKRDSSEEDPDNVYV